MQPVIYTFVIHIHLFPVSNNHNITVRLKKHCFQMFRRADSHIHTEFNLYDIYFEVTIAIFIESDSVLKQKYENSRCKLL